MIVAADAENAANAAGPSAEEKLKAAMSATARHWLAIDEQEQFAGACEGAARCVSEEDRERIEASLRLLRGLQAATEGVPVDFAALVPDGAEDEAMPKPFPLQKWWREIKDAA